jgi:hypothetical protein
MKAFGVLDGASQQMPVSIWYCLGRNPGQMLVKNQVKRYMLLQQGLVLTNY